MKMKREFNEKINKLKSEIYNLKVAKEKLEDERVPDYSQLRYDSFPEMIGLPTVAELIPLKEKELKELYDKYNETLEYEVYKVNQELEKVKNSSNAEIKFNYGVMTDKSSLIESLSSNVEKYESILEENKIKKEEI